ncbi:MAG: hypothetical protein JWQ81_5489 [Amycolatopsis sp.]|jgi:hypothetical protein|uniref:hypothetical protein n=1 Tax=Amycolatopsis sp. TaxID=37632 RepID=UPI0026051B50|nr:hypothetical protein [Amycolatopsis sp.]MCU1684750.1 hypothetical protein [Amycolatopsis sp.]
MAETGAHFDGPATVVPPAAGDAALNFLTDFGNASPTDTAQAQRISQAGQQMKSLALSGGFAISQEGFDRYKKACTDFLDGYTDVVHDLGTVAYPAPMGSSPYAYQVANFNVKVAGGDDQSLIPNLNLMKSGVEQALEALEIARKSYSEADEAHNQSLTKLNGDL